MIKNLEVAIATRVITFLELMEAFLANISSPEELAVAVSPLRTLLLIEMTEKYLLSFHYPPLKMSDLEQLSFPLRVLHLLIAGVQHHIL